MTPLAVVTGAASGIGAATADRFRRSGWDVVGLDVQPGPAVVEADVTDAASLAEAESSLPPGPLGALVCAAGIWDRADDGFRRVEMPIWERTWAVNVTGTMLTLRALAPRLERGSAVTTIASIAALVGMPRRDAYTASKGAVLALSRAWAADLIRFGIRVNCVCPGIAATPMTEERISPTHARELPLGRPATANEVAEVIFAVSGSETTYLNGTVIPVDGGLTSALRMADISPRFEA